jgi:hypothetical protein
MNGGAVRGVIIAAIFAIFAKPCVHCSKPQAQPIATSASSARGLLDGPAFDEEESSKSFQDAVLAWRQSSAANDKTSASSTTQHQPLKMWKAPPIPMEMEMQTDETPKVINTAIKFQTSSSLSLMERILLNKNRVNSAQARPSSTSAPILDKSQLDIRDDDASASEYTESSLRNALEDGSLNLNEAGLNFMHGRGSQSYLRFESQDNFNTITVEECAADDDNTADESMYAVDERQEDVPAPIETVKTRPSTSHEQVIVQEWNESNLDTATPTTPPVTGSFEGQSLQGYAQSASFDLRDSLDIGVLD